MFCFIRCGFAARAPIEVQRLCEPFASSFLRRHFAPFSSCRVLDSCLCLQFAMNKIGYVKDGQSRFNLATHGYGDGNGWW